MIETEQDSKSLEISFLNQRIADLNKELKRYIEYNETLHKKIGDMRKQIDRQDIDYLNLREDRKDLLRTIDQANAKIEVKDKRIKELEIVNADFTSNDTTKTLSQSEYLKGYKDGLDYAHNFVAKYLNEVKK